jgi:YHS domain-containing protein
VAGACLARQAPSISKPPLETVASVAIIGRVLQIILWVALAVWLGVLIVSRLVRGRRRPAEEVRSTRLRRDPVCGTFVSPEISCTYECDGSVYHFCSDECRGRFMKSHPRAAAGA